MILGFVIIHTFVCGPSAGESSTWWGRAGWFGIYILVNVERNETRWRAAMQRQWMTTNMAINHQRTMAATQVAINHNQSMLQPTTTPTNTNLAIATQQYHTPSKQHIAESMSHAQNELHILTHDAVEWVFLFGIVRLRTNSLHECHNPQLTKR